MHTFNTILTLKIVVSATLVARGTSMVGKLVDMSTCKLKIVLNVVRKFAHLLDRSDTDYLEEIGKLISQPHNLNFSDE